MHVRRPTPRLRLRPLILAIAAVLLAATPLVAVQSGEPAPAFTAPVLGGPGSLSLEKFRGKVVYLDFWASWCAPCAISLPALDSLRDEFAKDEFQVLAINVDRDPSKARDFLARRPVRYPSVADSKGELPARFGVQTMPTSFLIDREGVIRYVHRGFRSGDVDQLRAEIRKLLAGSR